MGERTGIAWTHHTLNPWTGCLRVSPGCDNCYAASFSKRNPATFGSWEPGAARKRTSEATWRKAISWDRAAAKAGERRRVFCASMADVFDNQAPEQWRADLWALIDACPNLDFLLLTKRPQNIAKMLPVGWGAGWPNVWLGCTAENQTELDRRWPHLARVPAAVRFLSCEPLLWWLTLPMQNPGWVIIGGESGGGARPMLRYWAADLIEQCRQRGIPAFFKQIGSKRLDDWPAGITGKGDDPAQWPPFFRTQEFPSGLTGFPTGAAA